MIRIVGMIKDHHLDKDISIDNLDVNAYKWVWVDFDQPTEAEIGHLETTFHFHPLAIEDCIHRLQRPKLDYYEDHTFYVTHCIEEKDEEITKEELNFFLGEKYVVTFHHAPSKEVNEVWDNLMTLPKNVNKWDEHYVFYEVLDNVVDNYFPFLYNMEDQLDKIEDNTQNKSMNQLMEELFDTRYALLNLRHTINPMRDLLYRMLNSHRLSGVLKRKEYFSDIYDHLLKLSEMVMNNRELTADIRDNYLSLNSHQSNNVMKVLTIITSIFAPLTFIAGIYGMNFENMPELRWHYGYFAALGVMGVLGVSLYIWFKMKGWFK